jgi:hypothetical protein
MGYYKKSCTVKMMSVWRFLAISGCTGGLLLSGVENVAVKMSGGFTIAKGMKILIR